jgi:hypothetical protein
VPAALSRTPTTWYHCPTTGVVVPIARTALLTLLSASCIDSRNLLPKNSLYCSQKPLTTAPSWLTMVRQPVSASSFTQVATVKLPAVSTTGPAVEPLALPPLNCRAWPMRPATAVVLARVIGRLLPELSGAVLPLSVSKLQAPASPPGAAPPPVGGGVLDVTS